LRPFALARWSGLPYNSRVPVPRKYSFRYALEAAAPLIALMSLLKLVELVAGLTFAGHGIVPRDPRGAIGILTAPLLHANLAHLFANISPLLILLVLLFWDKTYHPTRTLTTIWLASGLGTWLIGRATGPDGRPTVHLGASSLIFGLVAYLLVAGVLAGRWRTFLVAVLVFLAFGGIYVGVLPNDGPVSWEGHLSGALAGLITAFHHHGGKSRKR
jgi:membrane associated rhomboid family serine protease